MNPSNSRFPWKTFAILTAAGTLTGPLVLPYSFGLQAIVPHPEPLPAMPLAMLALLSMARGLVFCAPAAALGLLLARRIGLGAPWLEHWLDGAVRPAAFADPVPAIVGLRTVLIILPVGLAFGWLYMRRGLEAAILSHFFVDVIVHVVRPLVERHG